LFCVSISAIRALPDYNRGEDEAICNFQNRISNIVMQEVKLWQIARMSNEGEQKRQERRE